MAALVMAAAAVTALIVVPLQISSADRIQRDQTAREIYREFLNLTVQKPDLAKGHYCSMPDESARIAYEAYVEYLLYTAEQIIDSDPAWESPMASYLSDHMEYFCSKQPWDQQTAGVRDIIDELRVDCPQVTACS